MAMLGLACFVGLPALLLAPAATASVFDCRLELSRSARAWPEDKRSWCCRQEGVGCATASSDRRLGSEVEEVLDCDAGYSDWKEQWSLAKQAFCCQTSGRACRTRTSTSPAPFDCMAGRASRARAWSESKKAWCCHAIGLGCPPSSPQQQQQQPCDGESTGGSGGGGLQDGGPTSTVPPWLPTSTTTEPPRWACEAGATDWATKWPFEKQDWCCRHEGRACRDPFDCFDGTVVAWPRLKVEWCCKHTSLGCLALGRKFEQQSDALEAGPSSGAAWSSGGRRHMLAIAALVSTGFGVAAYASIVGFRSQAAGVLLAATPEASGEYSPVPAAPA